MDKLLTPEQVCEILAISKEYLYRMNYLGRLKPVRISHRTIRYTAEEIERFIAESAANNGGGH